MSKFKSEHIQTTAAVLELTKRDLPNLLNTDLEKLSTHQLIMVVALKDLTVAWQEQIKLDQMA